MNTIVNQEGFSFGWNRSLVTSTPMQDGYFSPRDWQNNAFDQLKDAPYMILNAPMGSGKSWFMCLLSAYKLGQNTDMRCIVAVPQTIIAPGFASAKLLMPGGEKLLWHPKHNLCSKEKSKGTVQYIIKWLERDHDSINGRV